jgi:DNA/RNA endonuclease G (NUC1)
MKTPTLRVGRIAALALALVACNSDRLSSPSVAAPRAAMDAAPAAALVITEIMANAANVVSSSIEQEFIEVFNAGNADADLSTYTLWSITGSGAVESNKAIVAMASGSLIVHPNSCVVIANNLVAGATSFKNSTVAIAGKMGVSFLNGTDYVALKDPAGTTVDSVAWTSSGISDGRSSSINVADAADPTSVDNSKLGTAGWTETPTTGPFYDSDSKSRGTPGTCGYGTAVVGPLATLSITPATANIVVGSTQQFRAKGFDAVGHEIADPVVEWSSTNPEFTTVDVETGLATGVTVGDTKVKATAGTIAAEATVHVLAQPTPLPPGLPSTRFTEIHYDNVGTDANEAIEIEGDAGTGLSGWSIVLYTGSDGTVYRTVDLSGTFANSCNGRGALSFSISGIQNGGFDTVEPDGFALVHDGVPIQFLSYEGDFTATDGPLAGLSSTDIGLEETSSTTATQSIQFNTAGSWEKRSASFGQVNACAVAIGTASISIAHNGPDTLVVGWERRAFVTFRDANGTVVSPTPTITWSSDTPETASVDSRGYAAGLSAGTAVIRATIGTTSGTYSFAVIDYQPVIAQYRNHLEFGIPGGADPGNNIVLFRPGFVTSYNPARGGPNWVSWNINGSTFGDAERCECFSSDLQLGTVPTPPIATAQRINDQDYVNGGYDRGHMVQSESRTSTHSENAATFLLTNILPQAGNNNQGVWLGFENFLNDRARIDGKQVYVVAGGEYSPNPATLKGEGRVAIPEFTWKVAIVVNNGVGLLDVHGPADISVYAVRMPNLLTTAPAKGPNFLPFVTTVDDIEARTGYDFFAALPDDIERIVEANDHPPVAVLDAPGTGLEGSPITFDASASTDPDAGDVLTYAWTFTNGITSTSPSPTVIFADDGTYTANLTVTDKYGATSRVTRTIVIGNVAPSVAAFTGASILRGETYAAGGTFSDPGTDTFTASVNYGDGTGTLPLSLSGNAFALSHAYAPAGTFTVTVTVGDDDAGTGSRSATVTVISAADAIDVLSSKVAVLEAAGALSKGETSALDASLRNALKSVEGGNATPARDQLEAFINKVEAMQGSGRIDAAAATALIDYARRVIASIA